MAEYANVIVDISLEKLDKTFQYQIPEELKDTLAVGMQVKIPFGSRQLTGYVVELTDTPEYSVDKMKPILGVAEGSVAIESQMIALAAWMRRNYGSTMNQALKTVLPVRRKTQGIERRTVRLAVSKGEAMQKLSLFEAKHYTAKARLLRELIEEGEIDYSVITQKLHIAAAVVKGLREQQLLTVQSTSEYRNPVGHLSSRGYGLTLNAAQQSIVDTVMEDRKNGEFLTYLLKGVTGSGKTEVYMEIIAQVIAEGRQAIVLIPEIALTYQTVMRFYNRFGDRVSILNSRLSAGERYDQYLRAQNGDIDIMIGPRSALFSPFANLGLIILDEEHENSYKSETAPRYHARETAVQRAKMCGASVILGSATPSVESYYQAKLGNYRLLTLAERVESRPLPECEVVDLRAELKNGNRSILSWRLQELMEEKLKQNEQIMLFLNRRGVSGFVSCRECGHVIKCPHCDVSLSQHNNGRMVCHYCGYEEPAPVVCPACGSKYISGFKAGTQKIEQIVQARFPGVRTLRMDFDTTRTKDSYEQILQAFGNHEADILIGTQMIVKGHDFADVTLVGILAADMSLHVSDYHASERTFQLLTQAAGRAGRGSRPGQVVIQTYDPDHFAIQTARRQDYEAFYEQEKLYREMLHYPPVWNMLVILCSSPDEQALAVSAEALGRTLSGLIGQPRGIDAFGCTHAKGAAASEPGFCGGMGQEAPVQMIGPADAAVSKINDIYRKVIYLKTSDYDKLIAVKDEVERLAASDAAYKNITIQFDFNPMSGF